MTENKRYDTIDIFLYLWKNRKPIIIITALGAVISVIISLFLQNYYKATVILFPTRFISVPISTLQQTVNQEMDPMLIGKEDDVERMIQMLHSDFITNKIVEKYNLISRYDISPNDPHLISKLHKMFDDNITYQKTKYMGVEIDVVDYDPKVAASIANDIAGLYDSLIFEVQKDRAQDVYDVAVNAYNKQLDYVNQLRDSLDFFRQKGILEYKEEVDRISQAYWQSLGKNTLTQQSKHEFEQKIDTLKKYGKQAQLLLNMLDPASSVLKQLADLQVDVNRAEQNLNMVISHKYIVNKAFAPDKKDFPKRSFIVIFSTIGAFIFAIVLLLILDFYKEVKSRINNKTN